MGLGGPRDGGERKVVIWRGWIASGDHILEATPVVS